MSLSRLRSISLLFPGASTQCRNFFRYTALLLGQVANSRMDADRITMLPTNPPGSHPITYLCMADVQHPYVLLDTERYIDVTMESFHLGNMAGEQVDLSTVPAPTQSDDRLLSVEELYSRLEGHVLRIDHTGVNLPCTSVDRADWDDLVRSLASVSTMYRYPSGEEWPFILPSTEEEFGSDIQDFVVGREPKFELVYDEFAQHPVIQISLETDLDRDELEALLPDPYGVAFPDLGDIFRTVYVSHPWPDLTIRFDLNYTSRGQVSDWDTGEWLVLRGGRIR